MPEPERSASLTLAQARLGRLRSMQASVEHQARELELAYAGLIEGLALLSRRLVEVTAQGTAPGPEGREELEGLAETVERRLAARPPQLEEPERG